MVQIKGTQGKRVPMSSEPEHLLVLAIEPDGTAQEIHNGPSALQQAGHEAEERTVKHQPESPPRAEERA